MTDGKTIIFCFCFLVPETSTKKNTKSKHLYDTKLKISKTEQTKPKNKFKLSLESHTKCGSENWWVSIPTS